MANTKKSTATNAKANVKTTTKTTAKVETPVAVTDTNTESVKTVETVETVEETKAVETVKENTEKEEIKMPEKRKFQDEDLIPCVSITPGELFMVGEKSKTLYTWADAEDVVDVEYRDLAYAARSGSKTMFKPRFIVQDKDFLAQFPKLEDAYGSMYSMADLKAILKLPPSQLKSEVNMLPVGAKDALKSIIATMIDNGTFDSIQRIKVLDEIFGTQMLLRMTM